VLQISTVLQAILIGLVVFVTLSKRMMVQNLEMQKRSPLPDSQRHRPISLEDTVCCLLIVCCLCDYYMPHCILLYWVRILLFWVCIIVCLLYYVRIILFAFYCIVLFTFIVLWCTTA
jgi:hypothetical protein